MANPKIEYSSDSRLAFSLVGARALLLVLLAVVFVAGAWWATGRRVLNADGTYEIGGAAVEFDARAEAFLRTPQAGGRIRIIDSGLEEGRGLTFYRDRNGAQHVLVADAWDAIVNCAIVRSGDAIALGDCAPVPASHRFCPDDDCESVVDHGGVMMGEGGHLFVADAHKRRLLMTDIGNPGNSKAIASVRLGEIRDVAVIGPDDVVVATTSDERGAIYEVDGAENVTLVAGAAQPVGVAYSPVSKRLYVADAGDRSMTWRIFERRDGWRETGILWHQTFDGPWARPALRSIAVGSDAGGNTDIIFAGADDGLYVFHADGSMLAKFSLGTPVSGLTWGAEGDLFLTAGRRLCVLRTKVRAR